jgi:hypothetical protein
MLALSSTITRGPAVVASQHARNKAHDIWTRDGAGVCGVIQRVGAEVPSREIEVPMQIGEILRPENFVPMPEVIRNDPQLMYSLDMCNKWFGLCDRLKFHGDIGRAYIDPKELQGPVRVTDD